MFYLSEKLTTLFCLLFILIANTAYGNEKVGRIIQTNKKFSRAAAKVKKKVKLQEGDLLSIRKKGGKEVCWGNIVVTSIKKKRVILDISQCSSRKLVKKGMELLLVKGDDKLAYNNFSLSTFFTISQGTLKETISGSSTEVSSTQNSPATIGAMFGYRGSKSLTSFSSSFYLSHLTSNNVSNSGGDASVPMEYGVNAYVQRTIPKIKLFPYFGVDYEKFSTYNTEELATDANAELSIRNNNIGFATLGIGKLFQVDNNKILAKISYSRGIFSSSDNGTPFKGSKFIIYLNDQITKRLIIHFLYKVHLLEGSTNLTVQRAGVGFGYRFL
jgi:hypothetical protein